MTFDPPILVILTAFVFTIGGLIGYLEGTVKGRSEGYDEGWHQAVVSQMKAGR